MLRRSAAIVIGPTPPGTGVRSPATSADVRRDVAHDLAVDAVDPDVDDGRARPDHLGRDHPGAADRSDHDVGLADERAEVARAAVRERHGRVLGEEQERHRLSHDVRAADDDGARALELDLVVAEDLHDPRGCRRRERRAALEQEAGVRGMEAVHVLHRVDRVDDAVLVDLLRQGELREDPGHARVGVQVGDEREQVGLGGVRGELVVDRLDAGLGAGLALHAHVDGRGGVVADEHGGEPDRNAERGHVAGHLAANRCGKRLSVHQGGGHGRGAYLDRVTPFGDLRGIDPDPYSDHAAL